MGCCVNHKLLDRQEKADVKYIENTQKCGSGIFTNNNSDGTLLLL